MKRIYTTREETELSKDVFNLKMNRRQFLKGSAMAAAALSAVPGALAEGTLEAAPAEAASEEKIPEREVEETNDNDQE